MQKLTQRQAIKREKSLLKQFKTLTRVMTPRGDISIEVRGDRACTDYDKIILPHGDFSDNDYCELLEGLVDHEAGHIQHSSKSVLQKAKLLGDRVNDLRNIIEDVRMERLVCEEFPGARVNLEKLVRQAIKLDWFGNVEPNAQPLTILRSFVLYYGRSVYCSQFALREFADHAFSLLCDAVGDVANKVKALVDTIPRLQKPENSLELAQSILALLKQESDQSEPSANEQHGSEGKSPSDNANEQNRQSSGNDSQSNPQQDTGDNQSQANGEKQSGKPDQSQQSKAEHGDAPGETEGSFNEPDGNQQNTASPNGEANQHSHGKTLDESQKQAFLKACLEANVEAMPDLHDLARQELEKRAKQAQSDGVVSRAEADPMSVRRIAVAGTFNEINARRAAMRVKQPLARIIYDMNHESVSHTKRGIQLDCNRLAAIRSGNHRVFRNELITKSPNTAISILVDRSGSMDGACTVNGFSQPEGWKMKTANCAAFALAVGLDALKGVKSEVMYYPFGDNIHLAKAFDEKASARHFAVSSAGGTPTGRVMRQALQRLALRQEPRKMLFVLTDGQPGDKQFVLKMVQDAQALGISVLAFGIGTVDVVGFEGQEVYIEDPSTLHLSVKDAIKQNLLKVS